MTSHQTHAATGIDKLWSLCGKARSSVSVRIFRGFVTCPDCRREVIRKEGPDVGMATCEHCDEKRECRFVETLDGGPAMLCSPCGDRREAIDAEEMEAV